MNRHHKIDKPSLTFPQMYPLLNQFVRVLFQHHCDFADALSHPISLISQSMIYLQLIINGNRFIKLSFNQILSKMDFR
jgi:hypothetical protein